MSENPVKGTVTANGNWTAHSVVRETRAGGTITFEPDTIAGSPFSMKLREAHTGTVFSDEVFWTDDDLTRKTLATDVLGHTRFTIDARGSQGGTDFSGKLYMD